MFDGLCRNVEAVASLGIDLIIDWSTKCQVLMLWFQQVQRRPTDSLSVLVGFGQVRPVSTAR